MDGHKRVCIAHGGDLSDPSGGTDRITAFATGLTRNEYDVTLVIPRPSGTLPPRLTDVDIITVPIQARGIIDQPIRATLVARRARKLATEQNTLLQIEHSNLAGVGSLVGCSDFILDMHDLTHASPLYRDRAMGSALQSVVRRIEGRGLAQAEKVIVVSERMKQLVIDEWGLPESRFSVIPNGYFRSIVDQYRRRDPVSGRVVFFGTLHPKVDPQALINIARLPEVSELVVIGDGARRTELEDARHQQDVSELRVMGRLPEQEAFELVASAVVAVNPQFSSLLQEASSPVKLYYYAALGLPMVLTEGPDIASRFSDAGAAVLVPEGGDFAAAVQSILNDDDKRQRMATSALREGECVTWTDRVESLLEVYA